MITYKVRKRTDGRTFYTAKNGDIEIVKKKDGTVYATIMGARNNSLNNTGYTREADIQDFDNVAQAKKWIDENYVKKM